MWGLIPVNGSFGRVTGKGSVSPVGEVTGTVIVDAASLDTQNPKRDRHLRSADFFDVANHPDLTVTVLGIRPTATGSTVMGGLTVRGRARPVAFDLAITADVDGEVILDGEILVNRADFGLDWKRMGMASMRSTVGFHLVFVRF